VISPILIQSVLNTDQAESLELINSSLIIWVLTLGLVPSLILITAYKALPTKNELKKVLKLSLLIFTLAIVSIFIAGKNIYSLRMLNSSLLSFAPYNYLFALKNYFAVYGTGTNQNTQNLAKIFSYKVATNLKSDLKVVVVIGESARSGNFQLNGYMRNTNPNLTKIENIISYPNAHSNATNTPLGVQAIMKKENYYHASSIISVFNELGFKTHWLSNQGTKYRIINSMAREAHTSIFSDEIRNLKLGNNYDADLLPFIKQAALSKENSFIVVHTMGSHRLYDLRYPADFKKFAPTCIKDQLFYSTNECRDVTELTNSYDNSILYTDYFLAEVIKIFMDKNALLIYISDHGESLGENGVYAHAWPLEKAPKEQTHIPLILWASKSILEDKSMKQNFKIAQHNQEKYLDQTNVFHTLIDCLNIESPSLDANKSLCKR
jgi:glucan phosphoethanolaminetransferase (alkaline phosphatase superfamily)